MNTQLPAPSLQNLDGIGCAAIGDFDLAEAYRWIGTEIQNDTYAEFYAVIVVGEGGITPPSGGTGLPGNYMLVEIDKRDMVLCEPCNEMNACPR